MDYDLKTLPAPVNKRAVPYPPPNYLPPEEDTPESAIAMSERGKYEQMMTNTASDRADIESQNKANQLEMNTKLEADRTGIPMDQLLNAERGPVITGATGDTGITFGDASTIPPYLDKMVTNMPKGPQEAEEEVPSWVLEQDASRPQYPSNVTPFSELEQDAKGENDDTILWAHNQQRVKDTLNNVTDAINKKSPTAIKEIDGKKFISKKFIDENKETLDSIASSFGFESSKDVLEALFNHADVKAGVGKTKFGSKEYAGANFKNLPTAEIEGKTLILPSIWDETHLSKAEDIAKKYGMKPAEFFAFIDHETGGTFNPSVTNGIGATGLVQFTGESAFDTLQLQKRSAEMEKIKQESGGKITNKQQAEINNKYPFRRDLSSYKEKQQAWKDSQYLVANMSLDDQLDLVDTYLESATRGKKGLANVYSSVFAGSPGKASIPMSRGNEGLDKNGDGIISRDEFISPVKEKLVYNNVKVSSGDEES